MATVFVDGVPAKLTVADFKRAYLAAFPKFKDRANDEILQDAIDAVYIMFDGVNILWACGDQDVWYDKATRCYLHLIAWYIANVYPRYAPGIQSTGGMPILSKKIGDVTIHYMDTSKLNSADSVLMSLKSNPYGNMALMMISGAPARFRLSTLRVRSIHHG